MNSRVEKQPSIVFRIKIKSTKYKGNKYMYFENSNCKYLKTYDLELDRYGLSHSNKLIKKSEGTYSDLMAAVPLSECSTSDAMTDKIEEYSKFYCGVSKLNGK